ncbi:MAG TPA: thioesterase [Marinilabiliaceae bacterium]|nr:thioesterase [Marinilabiliaceae bacterium]
MLYNKSEIKVRYGETDQMGVVNNAVYPSWFEIGRTELFDELGLPYSQMEKRGIMLPLSELYVKYLSPALYGEIVSIETTVDTFPGVRIVFNYKISCGQRLIATGHSVQAFISAETRRPIRIPDWLKDTLLPHFGEPEI